MEKKIRTAVLIAAVAAGLVFLISWLYLGIEIFGNGADPARMLPAAYIMAGAFVVLVPCLLFRIYVKFDRKYRSENETKQREDKQ